MKKNLFQRVFNSSPRRRTWWIFVVIIIIALAALLISGGNFYNKMSDSIAGATKNFVTLPKVKEVPFRLGLDLQGGSQLIYEADVKSLPESEKNAALEGVREVIERRINIFGVSEPVVQVNKTMAGAYRIIAELAGIKDVKEAIKMIGETPLLEFREKDDSAAASTADVDSKKLDELNKASDDQAKKILAQAVKGEDFVALAKANNPAQNIGVGNDSITVGAENDGDLDWVTEDVNPELVKPVKSLVKGQVYKNLITTKSAYHVVKLEDKRLRDGQKIMEYHLRDISFPIYTAADLAAAATSADGADVKWKNTQLTGKDLKRAVVNFDPNDGSPQVSLEFNDEGAKLFEEITARNVNKQVAIFLDGYPISIPTVNEKITGGKAVVTGTFTATEAKLLAQRLNTGALPVPISLVSQQTVGASLGQQSVNNSVKAGLIGLAVVALFMILFYRLPGLLSVGALVIYGFISLAIFKLWPVTMTLAGIAGFILSIGMAVDANILIFERLKEELRNGKELGRAIEDGFSRAWPSIRDSNFTTIIVCFVLIEFSTSVIKGFAVTLLLGVIISMFTAIFVTRNFLKLMSNKWLIKYHWLITSVKNKKEVSPVTELK
ncbi:protein translocase subunit SecD [Candidatus Falkowbacteria bacterium CG23_combo_of_CG06-09_8_20_14_all_41_10]|uniref:Protein translocase subunit SecD n=1 Tax=Candidatus Falkowbacteria bacterium CG23_combo_of_CG06-09_8_20_14_all_41_10 TaxID=1974571 RepID=A0A2G9ZNF8_9BACT|nr:MAG: protein translocase subunit SecD [Candidatus Falkowbacteria bacterium CG23_combo_of_CG06-09_8_20_14_all_41_10]